MRQIIPLAVALMISSCAAFEPITLSNSFDPSAISWADGRGSNALVGDALLRTVGGEPRTCAALTVRLIPDSPHATERFGLLFERADGGFKGVSALENVELLSNGDARFWTNARTTVCDAQGRFRFSDLPDGSYWVVAPVTWKSDPSSWFTEGGQLVRKVELAGGETETLVLSTE